MTASIVDIPTPVSAPAKVRTASVEGVENRASHCRRESPSDQTQRLHRPCVSLRVSFSRESNDFGDHGFATWSSSCRKCSSRRSVPAPGARCSPISGDDRNYEDLRLALLLARLASARPPDTVAVVLAPLGRLTTSHACTVFLLATVPNEQVIRRPASVQLPPPAETLLTPDAAGRVILNFTCVSAVRPRLLTVATSESTCKRPSLRDAVLAKLTFKSGFDGAFDFTITFLLVVAEPPSPVAVRVTS